MNESNKHLLIRLETGLASPVMNRAARQRLIHNLGRARGRGLLREPLLQDYPLTLEMVERMRAHAATLAPDEAMAYVDEETGEVTEVGPSEEPVA